MHIQRSFIPVSPASCSYLGSLFVALAQNRAQRQGAKPYIPNRLEWIAVELNAGVRMPLSEGRGYSMEFVPIENEDAILIFVKYLPSVNREVMNIDISGAREVIGIRAKSLGWTSWLKVREQVELATLK